MSNKLVPWWLALSIGAATFAALPGCDDKNKPGPAANNAGAKKDDADEEVEEKPIDPSKISAPAMAAIKKEIGEATVIKRALVGQKRGKPYYEAKYNTPAGERMMIQVADDGKIYKKVADDDPEPK
jgi:hypothetical protein